MTTAAGDQTNFPTMIIPRGTEIRVNQNGQLSIKTPGNLVIQNSGVYSEIESTNGSIRIEENVTVEAVSIRAGQACFIQGTLTAWKVHAKRISLEDRARAFIMLQESENLELSRTARLVGNFANEKELFFMMGKFSPQLKELPGSVDMSSAPREVTTGEVRPTTMKIPAMQNASSAAANDDEHLRAALALLEREVTRPDLAPADAEGVREVVYGLRERNLQRLNLIWRDALREVRTKSDAARQAYEHLEQVLR
ncbi:MAG: hypothetical protein JO197_20760 [Acidobacteria bacterium]|nr:hypothetical protein [Acidobacteriota bacterium]MBV9476978.1 hypothetical protein [Acidobacteriota bacterium]